MVLVGLGSNQGDSLEIMREAIEYVQEYGQDMGDSPAWPTGVSGF